MPIGPDDGARLAYEAVELVTNAELALLRQVTTRLRQGMDSPAWAAEKLAQLQMLRGSMARDLAALDADLARVVNGAVQRAYTLGQANAVADLDDLGLTVRLPDAQWNAITALAYDLQATVTGLAPVILRSVADAYQQAVGAELGSVLTGAQTRRQTAQAVLNRLLGQGITGFTDVAGRNWRLESYVEMAVRTGAGLSAVAGHADTLVASGQDLVQVIPGPRACPICDTWGGKILSLTGAGLETISADGRVPVAGTLDQARATGFQHPNCRCNVGIYLPGTSSTVVHRPDPAGYVAQQDQRRLERRIREAKRREALALDDVAAASKAGRQVRAAQADLRAHLAAHPELKRQRGREQIGRAL